MDRGTPGVPDVAVESSGCVVGLIDETPKEKGCPADNPSEALSPPHLPLRENTEMASLSPLTVLKVQARDCTI